MPEQEEALGEKVAGEDVPAAGPDHEFLIGFSMNYFFFLKFSPSSKTKKNGF